MRTVLLLSAAVLLAACADDQHSTAPASNRSSASRSLNPADVRPSSQLASSQGKPTDAVGFTKVAYLLSNTVFPAGGSGVAHSDCPAGTTIIGGGYAVDLPDGAPTTSLPTFAASLAGGSGWQVLVENNQPGAISRTILVQVLCAS